MSHEGQGPRDDDRDADIASMMRLAADQPPLGPEREARVRAAVHAEWRRSIARRARRRTATWVAGLAAAAGVVIAVGASLWPAPGDLTVADDHAPIRIEAVVGTVWSRVIDGGADGPVRLLEAGSRLPGGVELTTSDGSRAALRLSSGRSVRIDQSTRLRLRSEAAVELDSGALYIDAGADATGAAVVIHTELGEVHEIGTQFEVRRTGDALLVRLREGAVEVRRGEHTDEVRAGVELAIGADGTSVRRALPPAGPEWSWLTTVTPMLDLDGRTAREFLDWIARERGLRLAFDNDAVARMAAATRLAGSPRRLPIDQALDAVLPACRLTYRTDAGVLRIGASPQPGDRPR